MKRNRPAMGTLIYFAGMMMLGVYFMFAAVQGDYGVFKRTEITSEARALSAELERLHLEIANMENLTTRLSDTYLDLDLLDQQARDVLGLIRADEVVIH